MNKNKRAPVFNHRLGWGFRYPFFWGGIVVNPKENGESWDKPVDLSFRPRDGEKHHVESLM